MTAAEVTVNVVRTGSTVGMNRHRYKTGVVLAGAKVANGDKWILGNIKELVRVINITKDSDGTASTWTVSSNTVTIVGASTGAHSGFFVYK